MQLLAAETDPLKRWQQLCQINREFSKLRRLDLAAAHQRMDEERHQEEVGRGPEAGHRPHCAEDSPTTRPGRSADHDLPAAPNAIEAALRSKIHPSARASTQPESLPTLFLPPVDLTVPAKIGLNPCKSSLIGVNQGGNLPHNPLPC